MTVYLAGPINGCTDAEAKNWRETAKDFLHEKGVETLDPMRRDFRGVEGDHTEEIVEGDLVDIQEADVVLAMTPQPSYGTAMEIFYARHVLGKTVVAVTEQNSPWLTYHSDKRFSALDDALRYIVM